MLAVWQGFLSNDTSGQTAIYRRFIQTLAYTAGQEVNTFGIGLKDFSSQVSGNPLSDFNGLWIRPHVDCQMYRSDLHLSGSSTLYKITLLKNPTMFKSHRLEKLPLLCLMLKTVILGNN